MPPSLLTTRVIYGIMNEAYRTAFTISMWPSLQESARVWFEIIQIFHLQAHVLGLAYFTVLWFRWQIFPFHF